MRGLPIVLVVAARAHATCDVPWTTPQDTLASLAAAAERCDAIRVAAPPGGGDLGSLVDRFLAPRVRWRIAGEAPDGATLERFPLSHPRLRQSGGRITCSSSRKKKHRKDSDFSERARVDGYS